MVLIAAGWFLLMVRLLTLKPAAAFFVKSRKAIDRLAGVVFVGFGARLALLHVTSRWAEAAPRSIGQRNASIPDTEARGCHL